MSDQLVVLRVYPETLRAHLARTALEEAGIPAVVNDDFPGEPGLGKQELRVREQDVDRANAILAAAEDPEATTGTPPISAEELERQALAAGNALGTAPVAPTVDPEGLPPATSEPESEPPDEP
jgi:hypothetical protein